MSEQQSFSEVISAIIKKVASFLSDAKTIIGVIIGVITAIFFAGVYYSDASKQIEVYIDKIDRNETTLAELRSELQKMHSASGRVATKATDGAFAGDGSVGGFAGTFSLENQFVQCPPGTFVSALQGFKPNGQSPIVQIRYACRALK